VASVDEGLAGALVDGYGKAEGFDGGEGFEGAEGGDLVIVGPGRGGKEVSTSVQKEREAGAQGKDDLRGAERLLLSREKPARVTSSADGTEVRAKPLSLFDPVNCEGKGPSFSLERKSRKRKTHFKKPSPSTWPAFAPSLNTPVSRKMATSFFSVRERKARFTQRSGRSS
jgi:hypothetical protein